ncbi:MAG: class I SAM-dependent methyltransferase [Bacteroidales bacterium]|nr:class I SAM-dependent methyltransferase [Bacteroidales bacterium]
MRFSFNGFVYTLIIDPVLSGAQSDVTSRLKPEQKVLDVACGTGSLSLAMAGKVSHVTGIDLSEEMIDVAKRSAGRRGIKNVTFDNMDASDLSSFGDNEFDVAVSSMAVHQFDAGLALSILKEMKRIATEVVIMDYNYPVPPGILGPIIYTIERIAGGDHYRNFKIYNRLGGMDYFVRESGLEIASGT